MAAAFKKDDEIDCLDGFGNWEPAAIIGERSKGKSREVHVAFSRYHEPAWSEWIKASSSRLQPFDARVTSRIPKEDITPGSIFVHACLDVLYLCRVIEVDNADPVRCVRIGYVGEKAWPRFKFCRGFLGSGWVSPSALLPPEVLSASYEKYKKSACFLLFPLRLTHHLNNKLFVSLRRKYASAADLLALTTKDLRSAGVKECELVMEKLLEENEAAEDLAPRPVSTEIYEAVKARFLDAELPPKKGFEALQRDHTASSSGPLPAAHLYTASSSSKVAQQTLSYQKSAAFQLPKLRLSPQARRRSSGAARSRTRRVGDSRVKLEDELHEEKSEASRSRVKKRRSSVTRLEPKSRNKKRRLSAPVGVGNKRDLRRSPRDHAPPTPPVKRKKRRTSSTGRSPKAEAPARARRRKTLTVTPEPQSSEEDSDGTSEESEQDSEHESAREHDSEVDDEKLLPSQKRHRRSGARKRKLSPDRRSARRRRSASKMKEEEEEEVIDAPKKRRQSGARGRRSAPKVKSEEEEEMGLPEKVFKRRRRRRKKSQPEEETVRLGEARVPVSRLKPMLDSTGLYEKRDTLALRERLREEGYLLIRRGHLEPAWRSRALAARRQIFATARRLDMVQKGTEAQPKDDDTAGITADALTGDMFQHRWDLDRFQQWQNAGTHEDTQQAYHYELKSVCDVVFGKNPAEDTERSSQSATQAVDINVLMNPSDSTDDGVETEEQGEAGSSSSSSSSSSHPRSASLTMSPPSTLSSSTASSIASSLHLKSASSSSVPSSSSESSALRSFQNKSSSPSSSSSSLPQMSPAPTSTSQPARNYIFHNDPPSHSSVPKERVALTAVTASSKPSRFPKESRKMLRDFCPMTMQPRFMHQGGKQYIGAGDPEARSPSQKHGAVSCDEQGPRSSSQSLSSSPRDGAVGGAEPEPHSSFQKNGFVCPESGEDASTTCNSASSQKLCSSSSSGQNSSGTANSPNSSHRDSGDTESAAGSTSHLVKEMSSNSAIVPNGINNRSSSSAKSRSDHGQNGVAEFESPEFHSLIPEITWLRLSRPHAATDIHADFWYFRTKSRFLRGQLGADILRGGASFFGSPDPTKRPSFPKALEKDSDCSICPFSTANSRQKHAEYTKLRAKRRKSRSSKLSFTTKKRRLAPKVLCGSCSEADVGLFTVWVSLSDIRSMDDCALVMAPRTHRSQKGFATEKIHPESFAGAESVDWVYPPAMQPGDILLFNAKVIHASTENRSERFRCSVDTRLCVWTDEKRFQRRFS